MLGALSSFSLAPYNYFLINFLTFSLFFIFIFKKKRINVKKIISFSYGWFFGFGYFLASLYWITISLTFDQNFKFLIPISLILVPGFLAIFYGMASLFFDIFSSKKIISSFFYFSLIFGIIELIRGSILTGFPWNLIAFSFSKNLNFIQILSVTGTYSFNLICISLFTCPAILFLKRSKKELIVFVSFALLSVFFLLFGLMQSDKFNSLKAEKHDYRIRAIASNISLNRFYFENEEQSIIDELISLSNVDKNQTTFFIWPEGIIPNSNLDEIKIYKDLFFNQFGENDLILMGINSSDNTEGFINFYNSLAIFDRELNVISSYKKINLVPFGEFLPLENILGKIGLKTITNNYQSFSSGKKREIIHINEEKFDFTFLPLICYEIIYSGKLSKNQDFNFIINISEDGWFGNSIGPKQHFAHSIFRSIESGKYIIRSANNGITAIINPLGKVENQIEYGRTGTIDFVESRHVKQVPFSKYGNKIFIMIILLYIFLIFSFNRFINE